MADRAEAASRETEDGEAMNQESVDALHYIRQQMRDELEKLETKKQQYENELKPINAKVDELRRRLDAIDDDLKGSGYL